MSNNLPPEAYRPAFVREIVFVGGDFGNDVDIATANATMDYSPRTQYERSQQLDPDTPLTDDVGKDYGVFSGEMSRTGTVEPFMPYPTGGPPPPPAPVIANFAPTSATEGDADTPFTVNGADFTAASVISFGGTDLATTFVTANQLTATIPAAQLAAAGTFPVVVEDPAGNSAPVDFTVDAP